MSTPELTNRQRIMQLITGTRRSARELAELIGAPERQVEDHLAHIVRTVGRDGTRRFVLEPSECLACGFVFRGRVRLNRPSRCPHCRSEDISAPRYGIELHSRSHG